MPKFGSVNADGKIWAGADYGYQSPASFQKLEQSGELRVGSSIVRRLGQAFNQLIDAVPGGRNYANAVGQAMQEDAAAKKKPLELIGMDPTAPTATTKAIDFLSEKSNVNRDILAAGIGVTQGAIEGRIGVSAAKALRNKPRSVGAMGANRSRQMPDVFLSDDAVKQALSGPIKPTQRVSDLNVAQLTNPPGIGPRGTQRFDVPGGRFNPATSDQMTQYRGPGLRSGSPDSSLLKPGTAGPKLQRGASAADTREMQSIRERLARLSDEGKADIRIPEDIRNKNIYDQAYGSIKNPIPADDMSVRLDQVFDNGLTMRSSGSSGGVSGQPAASLSSRLLREIRETGDNNTKLQRSLNATHRGPGKPVQAPAPLTKAQREAQNQAKAAARELRDARVALDKSRQTDPTLKEIKANSKPDAKWRREVDADIKEIVADMERTGEPYTRSDIIKARLENKRVPTKRDLVKDATIQEFFDNVQDQIQDGIVLPDFDFDNPENLSSLPLARRGRVEAIARRAGQGLPKGNRTGSTRKPQPPRDPRPKSEQIAARIAARQATEDARKTLRSGQPYKGSRPNKPDKGPGLTKADMPDNTNFPAFGQDGELVTTKFRGKTPKLDRSKGATAQTRETLKARFNDLIGLGNLTNRQQAQLLRLKSLLSISDKVFNEMMRNR